MYIYYHLVSTVLSSPTVSTSAQCTHHRRKVLIIGIDGTRGDIYHKLLQNNDLPNIARLQSVQHSICDSVYDRTCSHTHSGNRYQSLYRQYNYVNNSHLSTYTWMTSSGWISVLTGVDNNMHHVESNSMSSKLYYSDITSKLYPTFFKHCIEHDYITAATGTPHFLSSSLKYLHTLTYTPGILDFECSSTPDEHSTSSCNLSYRQAHLTFDSSRDISTTQFGIRHISGHVNNECADVIMTHYDKVDHAGHRYGWDSQEYQHALIVVDSQIGELLDAIELSVQERTEEWLIIITSDHGGRYNGHSHQLFYDETIPFTIGILQSHLILSHQLHELRQPISHMDVAPTVLHWLNITTATQYTGRIQAIK